jgi:branched-chain amino acid aminotransferase
MPKPHKKMNRYVITATMYYLNGQYLPKEEAKISILDLAILRGLSVFDYLRTYAGEPFHLQDHLERLQYSAHHVGLTLPNSLSEIEEIVHLVKAKNHLHEASIKILLTGGTSEDHFTPHQSNLIVFAYPLTSYPAHYYTNGIKVITTTLNRSLPTSKTTQYIPGIVAMQRAKAHCPQEALYLNPQGEILEATTSNFFAFKQDTLYTCCSDEILIGITRDIILKLAAPHFPIALKSIHQNEIAQIDEAFITASNKEVMPVVQIDATLIGNGRVGPRTKKIMELFRAYTEQTPWPALGIPRYQLKTPSI